jgi:hypothetical protein
MDGRGPAGETWGSSLGPTPMALRGCYQKPRPEIISRQGFHLMWNGTTNPAGVPAATTILRFPGSDAASPAARDRASSRKPVPPAVRHYGDAEADD